MMLLLLILGMMNTNMFTASPVKTGADILVSRELDIVAGKRIGLITNQTGRLSSGEFLVDALLAKGVQVTALFGPEHGVRGEADAGAQLEDATDPATGIVAYSLYGKTNKPTSAMLEEVDILMYDIQDVGARFYTYISTMKLAMDAAAEKGIPFVVLDRPNPLGRMIDGPVLEDSLRSFVGIVPIPVVYGLTCGELARMINELGWLDGGKRAELRIVEMEGWQPVLRWNDTVLPWVPPSPNIPTPETIEVYPATCFIEGTNLSEGRGTKDPFTMFGAPFIDGGTLARALNDMHLPGIQFDPVEFTPATSKHAGIACNGVRLTILDIHAFRPVFTGVSILQCLFAMYPKDLEIRRAGFLRLMGRTAVYTSLLKGTPAESIAEEWGEDVERYREISSRFYMY